MTLEQFQAAANLSAGLAARWFQPMTTAMDEFGINEPVAQAMFIAQVGHESSGFTKLVESFDYSVEGLKKTFSKRLSPYQAEMLGRTKKRPADYKAIANLVYANRYGNKSAGDGWKYRGRGLIQVTFLNNYLNCGNALGIDLVSQPELLEQDLHAARSAGWVWRSYGCGRSPSDLVKVTQLINGGINGLDDRNLRYKKARAALLV